MDVRKESRSPSELSAAPSIADRWLLHPITRFLVGGGAVLTLLSAGLTTLITIMGSEVLGLEVEAHLLIAAATLTYFACRAWVLHRTDFAQRRGDALIALSLAWFNLHGLSVFLFLFHGRFYAFTFWSIFLEIGIISVLALIGYLLVRSSSFAKALDILYTILLHSLLPFVGFFVALTALANVLIHL